jgi:squalene/oxidosqualene cyclase-like protein
MRTTRHDASNVLPLFPADTADPVGAALNVLSRGQGAEGSWKGDYGGPMFLLPMLVGTAHVTGVPLTGEQRSEMIRYLRNHQNPDGGWGLHIEGASHVFTSVLCYVAMRLLRAGAEDPGLTRARQWFLAQGGATASASWGKYFLAMLNLYEYEGLNPVPPELWLLPDQTPVHPGRLWCHCRAVYLPLSYLYGVRFKAPRTPLIQAIRAEIYDQPYERIDWAAARDRVAATDSYVPRSGVSHVVHRALLAYERRALGFLRKRALAFVLDHIRQEDENTGHICIGPVSKLFHLLVWHAASPGGAEVAAHRERLWDYLYQADDGLKMQGYNSSELWDLAFALQAIQATGRAAGHLDMVRRAHDYLDRTQVRADVPERERYYRDPSAGGWPFSTLPHGWPITDCTAEGIKAALAVEPLVERPISGERLTQAIELILYWQNDDGGWATYERTRGPRWLELFNPSDCFADIMIDYSYVECTSACMQALAAYGRRFPGLESQTIAAAMRRGRDYLLGQQRDDGSWEGSWGVCFTYGTWFGVLGLRAAGLDGSHSALVRAAEFLMARQLPDGGWGETPESNRQRRYVHADSGQAVMTSWALLALIHAGHRDSEAVRRGVEFLVRRQRPDGTWPAEHIAGMFNKTSAIHYDNYLKIFPLWALAEASRED